MPTHRLVLSLAVATAVPGCGARAGLDVSGPASGGAVAMGDSSSGGTTILNGSTAATGGQSSTRRNLAGGGASPSGGRSALATGGTTVVCDSTTNNSTDDDAGDADKVPIAVATGRIHACVLLSDGTARCWGDNSVGQLGDGTGKSSTVPVQVLGLSNALSISATDNRTCVLLDDGSIQCWGYDNWSFGIGGFAMARESPCTIPSIGKATMVSVGNGHACALLADGRLVCWGGNPFGQLGIGNTDDSLKGIPEYPALTGVRSVYAGTNDTCAIMADSSLYCWGDNQWGQLGIGSLATSSIPHNVPGLARVNAVTEGERHACAILDGGAVWCWGWGFAGDAIIDGSYGLYGWSPVVESWVSGPAIGIAGGDDWTCALLSDRSVQCWGFTPIANNTSTLRGPRTVPCISNVRALDVGGEFACAIRDDGSVKCWGTNEHGQLGNGSTTGSEYPVRVRGF